MKNTFTRMHLYIYTIMNTHLCTQIEHQTSLCAQSLAHKDTPKHIHTHTHVHTQKRNFTNTHTQIHRHRHEHRWVIQSRKVDCVHTDTHR